MMLGFGTGEISDNDLYVEPLETWRMWKFGYTYDDRQIPDLPFNTVLKEPRLVSTGINISSISQTPWKPKAKTPAVHWREEKAHRAPQVACKCGYWSFKKPVDLVTNFFGQYTTNVFGKVSIWGRVIEGSIGYRSEYAYPIEVWVYQGIVKAFRHKLEGRSLTQELALTYGIEVRTYDVAQAETFLSLIS